MTINWFNASEAEQFGKTLAQFVIERVPNSKDKAKNKSLTKQLEVADKLYLMIDQFKGNHKLNFYKKAKLGSAFKFELINAGYDSAFINQMTKGLMLKL